MSEKARDTDLRSALESVRGFTLVEMLVTMALTALIASVLWQAMHQITRIERMLQRSGVSGQLDLVRREWVRGLIQSALVEQIGARRQFTGDAHQLSLTSSESVAMPGMAGPSAHLRFELEASTQRRQLLIELGPLELTASSAAPVAVELLGWTGNQGRFRYLNADGTWLDQWPPEPSKLVPSGDLELDFLREARAALPRLPRAVWLDLGEALGGPMVIDVSTTQPGRGRLVQWEQQ